MSDPISHPGGPGSRRRGSLRRAAALALLLGLLGVAGTATADPALDLAGTWYVLVHYRDAASEDPEAERWSDRVWRFDRSGRRLAWTEFSLVRFVDRSGRFELLGSGREVRTLTAWRPNAAQEAEIASGVQVDGRDVRKKTLRGSAEKGYASGGAMRAESTSVIGYQESWTIEDPTGRPVFGRFALMGSGRSESAEGYTGFATDEILEGGRRLRGRFTRDGEQAGRFEMTRAGEVRMMDGKGARSRASAP